MPDRKWVHKVLGPDAIHKFYSAAIASQGFLYTCDHRHKHQDTALKCARQWADKQNALRGLPAEGRMVPQVPWALRVVV